MHIYFSGIGGVGIGPLARIAHDLGHDVSGSDKEASGFTRELEDAGIRVSIGQSRDQIATLHTDNPIDWFVYSSAVEKTNPNHPELVYVREQNIRMSKRDAYINEMLEINSLRMLAVAGTHGKTTTTGMLIWLFKQLDFPISYSVGSSISFGPYGQYQAGSEYFVYECDEFDRNFLAYHPYMALMTSVDYDHPDTYPTEQEYTEAFQDFAAQCEWVFCWSENADLFVRHDHDNVSVLQENDDHLEAIKLAGAHNRRNAWLAVQAVHEITSEPIDRLIELIGQFPGTGRRFEKLADNLYSDYAHHPTEIKATMQLAHELSDEVVVVYQPHQNVRQHAVADQYQDCFADAEMVYWIPTYLAREDPDLKVLTPQQLIDKLTDTSHAEPAELNDDLAEKLRAALHEKKLVLIMGAGPIDDWARATFT